MSSMHDLCASALALLIDAQPMFMHPVLAKQHLILKFFSKNKLEKHKTKFPILYFPLKDAAMNFEKLH